MTVTVVEADGLEPRFTSAPVPLLPLRFAEQGSIVTVPQGSREELRQSVEILMRTRPEERRFNPLYGTPDFTFRKARDLDPQEIVYEIAGQEPRADVEVEVEPAGAHCHITVTVRSAEET